MRGRDGGSVMMDVEEQVEVERREENEAHVRRCCDNSGAAPDRTADDVECSSLKCDGGKRNDDDRMNERKRRKWRFGLGLVVWMI